jgi:hypothetical protein
MGTERLVAEFIELHHRYKKADERIMVLQSSAIEGMRKIGTGCLEARLKTEFVTLAVEITRLLARMQEICQSMR